MSKTVAADHRMTPDKLREIAGWLDTYDAMAQLWLRGIPPSNADWDEAALQLRLDEAIEIVGNREIQVDLHLWADWLEANGG